MTKVKFSLAELQDLNDIVLLEKACFDYDRYNESQINADLINEDNLVIVAKLNNKIVGYVDYKIILDESELLKICVLDEFRGQGVGTKLLKFSYKHLKGVGSVFLEVSSNNYKGVNFYKKLGFEQISVRERYYDDGSDAIIMKLVL